jgi:hypothetical protein
VFNPQAVWFLIQSFMAEGDLAGGKSCKQVADGVPAQPGQDAFGALGSAERGNQFRRRGFRSPGLLDAQQDGEVVPK